MVIQSDPFATGFVGYVPLDGAAVAARTKLENEREARLRALLPPESRALAEAALRPPEPEPKQPQPTVNPRKVVRVRFERSTKPVTPKPSKMAGAARGVTQSFVQLDPAKLAAMPAKDHADAAAQIAAALSEANRRRGY